MASLKDLRSRIAATKATQKITKAMQMVAASKLRRAQAAAEAARPYASRMDAVLGNIAASVAGQENAPRLLRGSGSDQKHLLLVCTAERGLCGPFNTAIVRLARDRAITLGAEGKVAINRILLDGRAIAATVTLKSGDGAWYWKTAYDETLARFAPGVLLSAALTEELAENTAIARTDSCAGPGNPLLDNLWRERLNLCDRLIALHPRASFHLVCRLEGLRGAAIGAAKSMRRRFGQP